MCNDDAARRQLIAASEQKICFNMIFVIAGQTSGQAVSQGVDTLVFFSSSLPFWHFSDKSCLMERMVHERKATGTDESIDLELNGRLVGYTGGSTA